MDSGEYGQCDGCGEYFPKSHLRRCRHCGAVLCPNCQKRHVCFTNPLTHTTRSITVSKKERNVSYREPKERSFRKPSISRKTWVKIGVVILILLFVGIYLAVNADSIADSFRPDPHIKLDKSVSGEARSIIAFDVGSGAMESVTVKADAQVYIGAKQPESREIGYGNHWVMMTEDEAQNVFYDALVAQFNEIKLRRGFTDDQYVEMVTSFVQTIPYNNEAEDIPQYPVVTGIDKKGDCDETSMLLAGILSRAGYDVALLEFPKEEHMTAGIKTSDGYGYVDGYAVIETTNETWYVSQTNYTSAASVYPIGNGTKTYGSASQVKAILTYFDTLKQKWDSIETGVDTSLDRANSIYENYEALSKERDSINNQLDSLNRQLSAESISYETYSAQWDALENRFNTLTQQMDNLWNRYESSYDTYSNTLDSRNDWANIYNTLGKPKVCDRARMYQLIIVNPINF